MRRAIFVLLAVPLLLSLLATAAIGATTKFSIQLEGEGPAPDAKGHAQLELLPEAGLVCYTIKWKDVGSPVTGGHIHSDAAGAIEVSLFGGPLGSPSDYPGDKFTVSDCVSAPASTINAILADPTSFYVNLHTNPTFTSILRGDLE